MDINWKQIKIAGIVLLVGAGLFGTYQFVEMKGDLDRAERKIRALESESELQVQLFEWISVDVEELKTASDETQAGVEELADAIQSLRDWVFEISAYVGY